MQVAELRIPGAWSFTPVQHADDRGVFLEWYRHEIVAATVGHPLYLAQANHSVSKRDVLRGIHFAQVPPGQAKYVYCPRGAVLDFVIDIRPGSPTFGEYDVAQLDDVDRRAVYVSEGLGHAFVSLADDSVVAYLCSASFNPDREHGINPMDPDLAIDWRVEAPLLSPRDAAGPSLKEAEAAGVLTTYDECVAYTESLR